jgi:ATP-dependent DNA helicase RecG
VPTFDSPLKSLVGDTTAKALAKGLDLHTLGGLLRHYPRRYAERGEHTDIGSLQVGEQVTISAQVIRVNQRPMRNRPGKLLEVVVGDGTGDARRSITLTFFNQAWRQKDLQVGRWGLFAGKVTEFRGARQLNGPEYKLVEGESAEEAMEEFAGGLIPVYPAANGVPTWVIARCVRVALDTLPEVEDPLPDELRARRRLVGLADALRGIHRPDSWPTLNAARLRLKWDEALVLQTTLAQRRLAAAQRPGTARPPRPGGLLDAFDAILPFTLTDGQRAVGDELAAELTQAHPMHRLLQGEVGSGKTVVALRAMLQVVDAGGQAAMLAPTEVLAAQHARGIRALLGPLGQAGELGAAEDSTRVALLTGSLPAAARRSALAEAAGGEAGIVVGTHALLSEGVEFAQLGLVVVDEQHRFGVEQRDALRAKAGERPPHVLVMTATPIPRTVAMTVFGDLETSVLDQLPAGRSPIASHVVPVSDKPHFLDRAWQRVREEVAAGHQAYVVCPRIGADEPDDETEPPPESDTGRRPPVAVLDVAPMLAEGPLNGLRLAVLHGRLHSDEKDLAMREFAAGRIDVLVATTVIEVGVDVPNATAMVILDADRFGVSQLHQLRGRVGRGSAPGLCLLVTEAGDGTPARERLVSVAATTDGFELARLDLEQRREGDVLGSAQSGRRSQLKLLSLLRDEDVITAARDEAIALVEADPDLKQHQALAAAAAAMVDDERAGFLEKG